jgi:zinc transport system substrate-binding protein
MPPRRLPHRVLGLALAMLVAACGTPVPTATAPPGGSLKVAVSIAPQQYFVERIGGDKVNVSVMVPAGFNPATYEPRPSQIQALSETQMYVRIGVPFEEAWMDRFAAASEHMLIVDQSQRIERIDGTDPHVWLSPRLVKVQARTIFDGLVELDPDNESFYRPNLDAFLADLDELDASIEQTLADLESRKFMVFHPAWSYFARDYGLEMIPVQIEGSDPGGAEMADLIRTARESNIKVIFAQPEFSAERAATIAQEMGGEVLLISPLAPDWLDNLRQVTSTFAKVLADQK